MSRLNLKNLSPPLLIAALVLVAFTAAPAFGQGGYEITFDGSAGRPGTLNNDSWSTNFLWTSWKTSRSLTTNQWSSPRSLDSIAPGFEFEFYGQPVTDIMVSDNGVLTFDTTAVGLPGDNGTLPDPGLPADSVLFLWDNVYFNRLTSSNWIYTKSFGTAPNRQVWIKFYRWSLGTHRYTWFSYVLEETTNYMYTVIDYAHSTYGPLPTTTSQSEQKR